MGWDGEPALGARGGREGIADTGRWAGMGSQRWGPEGVGGGRG